MSLFATDMILHTGRNYKKMLLELVRMVSKDTGYRVNTKINFISL